MSYILNADKTINMPVSCKNQVIGELLSNYTFGTKWNIVCMGEENAITIGNFQKADLKDAEYIINVTDEGVYIGGKNYQGLMRGFISFIEKIKYMSESHSLYIENMLLAEKPMIDFRCVHLCILPETKLDFLKKCVRSAAIVKYSHIILEFWGMLKFDSLKELSWPFAYSKEEIKEIVAEANALGVEIIPMFNHLGHASLSRSINGKHVVLDQNPSLEYMYESYGWVWNYKREDVKKLLKNVREELIELCGEGEYFHIGFDEADCIEDDEGKATEVAEYLNDIIRDLKSKGRRAIMWHDMMLTRNKIEGYNANSTEKVANILMNNIDKSVLIADWQYWIYDSPWETSKVFKENNFEVVCCPWDEKKENIDSAIDTVTSNHLFGIIHTTWHTLFRGFNKMIYAGVASYGNNKNIDNTYAVYCAEVVRKALPSNGVYEKAGWTEVQIGPGM